VEMPAGVPPQPLMEEMPETNETPANPIETNSNKVHVSHPASNSAVRTAKPVEEGAELPGVLNVPPDEELFKRQYYTIGEVAAMFGANQSQIRFWENEFDILQPKKNKKGDRYFRPEDVKNLVLIHHLLRQRRFTIEGAREYLKRHSKRAADTHQAIQSLERLKAFLQEMKANLNK
jgi:DNA-binding transcriptional MerR regulator